MWHTGSGIPASFDQIILLIKDHTRKIGKVYVGADSQLSGDSCTFVTVICLHGGLDSTKKYFFKKEKVDRSGYGNLRRRINQEVSKSLEALVKIIELVPDVDVEVHVDVGRTDKSKTKPFVDSIVGWVRGLGVPCKVKPEAWASASVADRHTK